MGKSNLVFLCEIYGVNYNTLKNSWTKNEEAFREFSRRLNEVLDEIQWGYSEEGAKHLKKFLVNEVGEEVYRQVVEEPLEEEAEEPLEEEAEEPLEEEAEEVDVQEEVEKSIEISDHEIKVEEEYLEDEVQVEKYFIEMEFLQIDKGLFRSKQFNRLSPTAFKLWLILATKINPLGDVNLKVEDVPKYANEFKQDPRTTKKVLDELLNYTVKVGKETVHLLEIDEEDGFLRIPPKAGIGAHTYRNKVFVKAYIEPLKGLLALLRGSELFTLLAIGVHVDEEGCCFPSIATISEIQGVTPKIVSTNLRTLERLNLYDKEKTVYRKWEHNVYHLNQEKTGIVFI